MPRQNNASSEADARIVVDRLLREAGWNIEDKNQVTTEESIKDGRADYLLLDSRSRPLAVVEAKRFSKDPYTAKEQAEIYAQELLAPFIFLSNGTDTYFWDYDKSDARLVDSFSPALTWKELRHCENTKSRSQLFLFLRNFSFREMK